MPSIADKTGKTGVNMSYAFGTEKNPGNGERMVIEGLQPSNYTDIRISDASGKLKSVIENPAIINQIQALAGSYASVRKNIGQPTYSTVSSTGQPVVRFTINDFPEGDKTVPKVVEIPLSPHATGELLSGIPSNSGLYVYGELQRGKVLKSDNNDESMGFRYTVSPDNADKASIAKVKTQHLEVDPKTGQEYWKDNAPIDIRFSAFNPDQIMSGVNQERYNAISRLAEQRRLYNIQNAK